MKSKQNIGLSAVQAVYSGPEGKLWELIMGEQVHIGGLQSSMDLAERAEIQTGQRGVDFCCCTGAGMRFLIRFRSVAEMIGVDATETVVNLGRKRCAEAGMANSIQFVLADACDSRLPSDSVDFVWGEDAWCYVENKSQLISEAVRIVKPGGLIAFTDWVEGSVELTELEAERYLAFMKFPNILNFQEYCRLLSQQNCQILISEDTGRFAPYVDLYINMLTMQLTYDALQIIGFNQEIMQGLAGEMQFMQQLAHEKKIAQGILIAQKTR